MKNSNITIEIFKNSYKKSVIELILDIQTNEFNVPVSIHDQPDLGDISNFFQKDKGNFWVALDGDKIIGTIALIDIGNYQAALRKMFVAKKYRGKENGVAQKLLNTVIAWCEENDINEIYLGTHSILFAAHRFYEKNGFQEISKETLPSTFPIMKVDSKFYKYCLSS